MIKIIATRCQILRLKYIKFDFGCGSAPDPAGGAYSATTDPQAGFKGPLCGREREGVGMGKGEGRGMGTDGKWRGAGKGGRGNGRDGTGHGMGREGRERRKGRETEERGYSPQTSIPGAATDCRTCVLHRKSK